MSTPIPQASHASNGIFFRIEGDGEPLLTFDSRPWLKEISAPTLVVGGTHDTAVPKHHFDTLVHGIPGAVGRLVDRAGHTLI